MLYTDSAARSYVYRTPLFGIGFSYPFGPVQVIYYSNS